MSHDSDDQSVNFSGNTSFQEVLSSAVQNRGRRNIIKGGLGLATLAALPGLAVASKTVAQGLPSSLAFPSVAKSVLDQVTLPPGYSFTVLHAAGDPIDTTVPAYTNAKGLPASGIPQTAASCAKRPMVTRLTDVEPGLSGSISTL